MSLGQNGPWTTVPWTNVATPRTMYVEASLETRGKHPPAQLNQRSKD